MKPDKKTNRPVTQDSTPQGPGFHLPNSLSPHPLAPLDFSGKCLIKSEVKNDS